MLLLLQILAFLQLAVIPGLIVYKLIGLRTNIVRGSILIFALSPLVNFAFVFPMVCAGQFNRQNTFIFMLVELALLIFLYRRQLITFPCMKVFEETGRGAAVYARHKLHWINSLEPAQKSLCAISFFLAAFCLFLELHEVYMSSGSIFTMWDAPLSWNRWACSWFSGEFPEKVREYPQMIPTNWAMAYMVMGIDLQFVPKLTVTLFPFVTMLALFELGISRKSIMFITAVPVTAWLFRNVQFAMYGGEVDLSVTFFTLISFACIVYAYDEESKPGIMRWLVALSFLLCSAACAKQSGLMVLFLMPVIAVLVLYKKMHKSEIGRRQFTKLALLHILLIVVFVLPYYTFARIRIIKKIEISNINFVTNEIYAGKSKLERAIIGSRMYLCRLGLGMDEIRGARWTKVDMENGVISGIVKFYGWRTGPPAILVALLGLFLIIYAMKYPLCRWPFLLLVLPHSVIWSMFYCYDLRNLAFILPLLALTLAGGIDHVFARHGRLLMKIPLAAIVLVALGLVYLCCDVKVDNDIVRNHRIKETKIGEPTVNLKILEYNDVHPIKGKIATDYEYVDLVPGIKGSFFPEEFSEFSQKELNSYKSTIRNPEIGYLLVPNYTMKAIRDDIEEKKKTGEMTFIFYDSGYTFLKINRPGNNGASSK